MRIDVTRHCILVSVSSKEIKSTVDRPVRKTESPRLSSRYLHLIHPAKVVDTWADT